jgi:hypothetical protein
VSAWWLTKLAGLTAGHQIACRVSLFTQCPESKGSLSTPRVQSTLNYFAQAEAGHAVAAYFFGVPIKKKGATIISDPDKGTSGCLYIRNTIRERPDVSKSDRVRLCCEREALVFLAGMVAQRKFNRRSVRSYHGLPDYNAALDLMGYFFEPPVLDANLEFLTLRIQSELFEDHPYAWRCVEAVAATLLEKKQLSGAELKEIIERTLGVRSETPIPSNRTTPPRSGQAA